MKKLFFTLLGVGLLTLLASCETKTCVCYDAAGSRVVRNYVTTSAGTRCSALNVSGERACNEESDPLLDPDNMDPSGMK